MRKSIFITALLSLPLLCGCGSDSAADIPESPDNNEKAKTRADIELSPTEVRIMDAQTNFAINLFKESLKYKNEVSPEEKNLVISPLSMSICMSLLANGSAGATLSDILETLLPGTNATVSDLNTLNKNLVGQLCDVDNTVALDFANSSWLDNSLSYKPAFEEACGTYYDASLFVKDFNSLQTTRELNAWVKENTNGLIKQILPENKALSESSAVLALVNTLYFNGRWATAFKPSDTRKGKFVNCDGTKSDVDMMSAMVSAVQVNYHGNATVFGIPYGNSAYSFFVALPDEGTTVDDFINGLDEGKWKDIRNNRSIVTAEVQLPRFELEGGEIDMTNALISMGMESVFANPDLTAMLPIAKPMEMLLKTYQQTVLKVEETGTEGAAASFVLGITSSGGGSNVHEYKVDRPFMFFIEECSTGALLFMGKVDML